MTWTDGAVVAVEKPAPANSKSLVSNPVVGVQWWGHNPRTCTKPRKRSKKNDASTTKQMVANQVNQGVANQVKLVPKCQTNQINQANEELGNKEVVN